MKDHPKPTRARVMGCPCASQWLKSALQSSQHRDPVDAANDAEVLSQILNDELSEEGRFDKGVLNAIKNREAK